ncbi:hypothetical protein V8F33_004642 [Rhypophila sp. PSN 637]
MKMRKMTGPDLYSLKKLEEEGEDNPFVVGLVRLFQDPYYIVDRALHCTGVEDLKIHPDDLQDWLESDEVEPYWNEFRESWLEKGKAPAAVDKATCCIGSFAGPSRYDYSRVKQQVADIIPSFDDVVKAIDDVRVAPPAANMRLLPLAPYFRVRGRLDKAKWRKEDHWARFISQVAFRAYWKTLRSGDDVRADDRQFPSLWLVADESSMRDHRKALYRLLRCLTLRYYLQRTDEKSAKEYGERDLLGWD